MRCRLRGLLTGDGRVALVVVAVMVVIVVVDEERERARVCVCVKRESVCERERVREILKGY